MAAVGSLSAENRPALRACFLGRCRGVDGDATSGLSNCGGRRYVAMGIVGVVLLVGRRKRRRARRAYRRTYVRESEVCAIPKKAPRATLFRWREGPGVPHRALPAGPFFLQLEISSERRLKLPMPWVAHLEALGMSLAEFGATSTRLGAESSGSSSTNFGSMVDQVWADLDQHRTAFDWIWSDFDQIGSESGLGLNPAKSGPSRAQYLGWRATGTASGSLIGMSVVLALTESARFVGEVSPAGLAGRVVADIDEVIVDVVA